MRSAMTDIPQNDHQWTHEHLAAYLAGGLDPAERTRFESHIHACPDCFDAFTEAPDADRALQRALFPLNPNPKLEENIVTHLRARSRFFLAHPLLRRAAYPIAAAVALAATGLFANVALHSGHLNNQLSRFLIADADKMAPSLSWSKF